MKTLKKIYDAYGKHFIFVGSHLTIVQQLTLNQTINKMEHLPHIDLQGCEKYFKKKLFTPAPVTTSRDFENWPVAQLGAQASERWGKRQPTYS